MSTDVTCGRCGISDSSGRSVLVHIGTKECIDPLACVNRELASTEVAHDALATRVAELESEQARMSALLADPIAVRINILRGQIAVPPDLVWLGDTDGPVAKRVAEAVAAEREECAKLAEQSCFRSRDSNRVIAAAIRARGGR